MEESRDQHAIVEGNLMNALEKIVVLENKLSSVSELSETNSALKQELSLLKNTIESEKKTKENSKFLYLEIMIYFKVLRMKESNHEHELTKLKETYLSSSELVNSKLNAKESELKSLQEENATLLKQLNDFRETIDNYKDEVRILTQQQGELKKKFVSSHMDSSSTGE